ncbi:MAG: hypothetical protein GOMPHAMPRED_003382 [Gomphillus americanus]|uniref:Uncharacterized protein n=1 Tax=Gomphillus americanus TaxID=1940652 RepID=A0A8H3IA05_9LECA|nr:MAG: hypothetical protein GOMPHAMPRED_003382 [Gomphillus americanus]
MFSPPKILSISVDEEDEEKEEKEKEKEIRTKDQATKKYLLTAALAENVIRRVDKSTGMKAVKGLVDPSQYEGEIEDSDDDGSNDEEEEVEVDFWDGW